MPAIRRGSNAKISPSGLLDFVHGMMFDWKYFGYVMVAILVFEAIISAVIIVKVPC